MWPFQRKSSTSSPLSPDKGLGSAVRSCVVNNRVFLLGLDMLYREAMKSHERGELLVAAGRVAAALHVTPANVPIEGYYSEDQALTEYFLLIRALQEVGENRTDEVVTLPEFQRLLKVTSAPLFGRPQRAGKLFPVGRDALSQALLDTRPEWTVERLTAAAYALAREFDDISLVGLAARVRDPVVLAAVRESVVLYAEVASLFLAPSRPQYVWRVDADLAEQARRFIAIFNALFDNELPPPDPSQAECFWHAFMDNKIFGRCVRLGFDDTVSPIRHYHWGICITAAGELAMQEFWHPEVWTTARYRSALRSGECPDFGPESALTD
jgi:hypothetical protein